MEKNSIRIGKSNVISIEVNDQGETIEINPDDKRFILNLENFIKEFRGIQGEFQKKYAEIAKNGLQATEADVSALIELDAKFSEDLAKLVDKTFGADTCRKVFGENVLPSVDLVYEFMQAITPVVQKARASRVSKIAEKYGHKRNGGGKV